jgi:hypothetical protein
LQLVELFGSFSVLLQPGNGNRQVGAGSARWQVPARSCRSRARRLRTLFPDPRHQSAPRLGERLDAFALQSRRERFTVGAFAPELLEHRFGITAIGGQDCVNLAVVGEGEQGLVGIVLIVSGAARAAT